MEQADVHFLRPLQIRAEAIIAEREEELQRLTEQRTNEHMVGTVQGPVLNQSPIVCSL